MYVFEWFIVLQDALKGTPSCRLPTTIEKRGGPRGLKVYRQTHKLPEAWYKRTEKSWYWVRKWDGEKNFINAGSSSWLDNLIIHSIDEVEVRMDTFLEGMYIQEYTAL